MTEEIIEWRGTRLKRVEVGLDFKGPCTGCFFRSDKMQTCLLLGEGEAAPHCVGDNGTDYIFQEAKDD